MTGVSAPRRVQRRRTKGDRMPPGAVYVGRPSRFGNPYTVAAMQRRLEDLTDAGVDVSGLSAQELAVEAFTADLRHGPDSAWWWFGPHEAMLTIMRDVGELAGRDLACWCPVGSPCHGDVLLRVANGGRA